MGRLRLEMRETRFLTPEAPGVAREADPYLQVSVRRLGVLVTLLSSLVSAVEHSGSRLNIFASVTSVITRTVNGSLSVESDGAPRQSGSSARQAPEGRLIPGRKVRPKV